MTRKINRAFNGGSDPTCPCKDCTEREMKCHGKCDEYKSWKAKHDKAKDAEREYRMFKAYKGW